MPSTVPEEAAHTPGYGPGAIPAVVYDAALPADVLPCPAGIFSVKVVSLKMMFLHYLIFLLEIVKEEDAEKSMCVCVCLSV